MRHSVVLEYHKCRGCTTCIKNCPTEAIRVRNGKATILPNRCIDCGTCLRGVPAPRGDFHARQFQLPPELPVHRGRPRPGPLRAVPQPGQPGPDPGQPAGAGLRAASTRPPRGRRAAHRLPDQPAGGPGPPRPGDLLRVSGGGAADPHPLPQPAGQHLSPAAAHRAGGHPGPGEGGAGDRPVPSGDRGILHCPLLFPGHRGLFPPTGRSPRCWTGPSPSGTYTKRCSPP